jgi:dTDP-6-deoxy-L-talose 4-dehydrogenase (NAD+)
LKKILITGSQGFIGKNLIKNLVNEKKFEIHATCRKKFIKNYKNVKWIKVKNLQSDSINKFKYDILVDLAWYDLDNYNSQTHIKKQVTEHFVFYKKLLKKNKKINIFSFGTCLEYGLREGKLVENMISDPKINYARGKDILRKKIMYLKKKYDFSINWLRLFYIYGEGQEKRKIYSQFINAIKSRKKFFIMSKGTQKRDYIHIKSVVKIIIILIRKNVNVGIINLCTGNSIRVIDLVRKWKKKFKSNIKLKIGSLDIPNYEPQIFYGSVKKLNNIIKKNE